MIKKIAVFLAGLAALSVLSMPRETADLQTEPARAAEMKLRVFEGIRESGGTKTMAVTSSYLKYSLSMSIESGDDLAEEQQQIKRVFNLIDVKLLTEANLTWGSKTASHVFRINGREYLVEVTQAAAERQFRIEVFEWIKGERTSLLDMSYAIPAKNAVVFGFEDTSGKPYFISTRVTRWSIAGGVVGGVAGGVVGGVAQTIRAPRIIKEVEPSYPEEARKAKIEGDVFLEATTDVYGRVAAVKVLRSVPALDQAAVDALRQWVYEPMIVDGKPRPVVFTVMMRFKLGEPAGKVARLETTGVGGVRGGVEGGVSGGVSGGVRGGVAGGLAPVKRGLEGETGSQKYDEFAKDAVRIPRDQDSPAVKKYVPPAYPKTAREARVEGTVILEVGTNEDGEVEIAKLLRSIPILDQAAIDAVTQWTYEPFLFEGKPRKALFTVIVRFQLKGGAETTAQDEFAGDAVKAAGSVKPPKILKYVAPLYPEIARQAGVEGTVLLSVKTDPAGKVLDAMVLRSIPLLDQAAIDAVKQWEYEPSIIDGKPQPIVFTVAVQFALKEGPGTRVRTIGPGARDR